MKKYKLIPLVFLLLPFHLLAQEDITGLWKGTLYNDTTKEYLPYEIAISDDNGKLSGYSYTVFHGDKGDEIGIKTIYIKRKDDNIIIEDIKLIANSYTVEVSKNVRKLIKLTLNVKDSVMTMSGTFKTNYIRQYRPVTGKIEIHKKNNFWKQEPLIRKLDEMKLLGDLSFVKSEKRQEGLAEIKPIETASPSEEKKNITATGNRNKKEKLTNVPSKGSSNMAFAKDLNEEKEQQSTSTSPKDQAGTAVVKRSKKEKKEEAKKLKTNEPKPLPITKAAADAYIRKTQTIQTVYFKTDSLVFILYDNGIVDGDTVSILMNGNLIFSKQGLSEKPVSKTIYAKNIPDSSVLILYAENLGSIPPNTGLLIIYDGKKRYEVFFSADLSNNAAIILRRKKDE